MPERPLLPRVLADALALDAERAAAEAREEAFAVVRAELVHAYAAALREALSGARSGAPAPGFGPSSAVPAPAAHGCYVYAIVRGDGAGAGAGMPGIDPSGQVRLVRVDDLTAVVSDVLLDRLAALSGGDATEDGVLAAAVTVHDAVVDRAFRAGPVVPLRFGTVLACDDDVVALVRERDVALRRMLDRLSGVQEWGVKLRTDMPDESAPAPPPEDGRSYLQARSRQREARVREEESRTSTAHLVHDALRQIAEEAVVEITSSPDPATVVLNGSYLVRAEDEPRFQATVNGLADTIAPAGYRLSRTGPWPPYHFVDLDVDDVSDPAVEVP